MIRALDLFCGGGGAARGILAAGFDEVVGIDNVDHRKAYPGHFILSDALHPPVRLDDFDFVWASPPCQKFSPAAMNRPPEQRREHPNLLPQTRALLMRASASCMENVPKAPLRADVSLTGAMFDLDIKRERIFEIAGFEPPFALLKHDVRTVMDGGLAIVAGQGANNPHKRYVGWRELPDDLRRRLSAKNCKAGWADAMGLPLTMTRDEIKEAVPPAYAEFIAREALRQIRAR